MYKIKVLFTLLRMSLSKINKNKIAETFLNKNRPTEQNKRLWDYLILNRYWTYAKRCPKCDNVTWSGYCDNRKCEIAGSRIEELFGETVISRKTT